MLVVSIFTFIGLAGFQSISYLIDGSKFSIDLAVEEESETKTNEELKTKVELRSIDYSLVINESNHMTATELHIHLFVLSSLHAEVATPPPKT